MALVVWAAVTTASAQNTFILSTTLTSSTGVSSPSQVEAAAVKGDGKVDLVCANTVLTNNGHGVFNSALSFNNAISLRSGGWVAGDVLGNGRVDLITLTNSPVSPYPESIVVYTNSGPSGFNGSFSLGLWSDTTNLGNTTLSGSQGSGSLASAGDVYGNGRMNLFYFNSVSNSLALYTNNGSGAFGSNTTFNLKMNLPAVADVNRDGNVDFIAPWYSNNIVYVFTNNGSGVYGSNASLKVKSPFKVVAADVNGDSWADLIVESVTNVSGEPQTTILVWTNNESGTFGSNVSFTVGALGEQVMDIKATNVFGDENVDLVFAVTDFAHGENGYLMVYTNNGLGGFGSNITVSVGNDAYTTGVAVGDVNGDGSLDLAAANDLADTLTVYTNTGSGIQTGSFMSNSMPVLFTNSFGLLAADLYRNGKLDLITALNNYPTLASLLVLTNNGSGMFGSNALVSGFTANNSTYIDSSPIAADIFGNGSPALIVGLEYNNNSAGLLVVLTNNGAGVFGTNSSISLGFTPLTVVAMDVNGDSKPDLIVSGYTESGNRYYVTVLTNNGAGGFVTNVTLQLNGYAQLAMADVNADGRPDLITAYNYNGYSWLTVFTNTSATGTGPLYGGTYFGGTSYSAYANYQVAQGAQPSALVVADVNGDGNPDVVIANNNNPGTLSVMTNSGYNQNSSSAYTFGSNSAPVVGAFPHALAAADVNYDGKLDLVSANFGLITNTSDARGPLNYGTLTVLTNNGSGVFTNPATFSTGMGPTAVIAADVNGDGKVDLITANTTSFTNQTSEVSGIIWYGLGGGTLSILLNTSNFLNTVALETAPSDSPITYGQTLSAAGLSGGVATNEAGATVAGTFAFTTNSLPNAGTSNYPAAFTPAPPTDYQPVTFNVSVTVNQLVAILKGTRAYDGTTNVVFGVLSVSNKVGSDNVTVSAGSVGLATANIGTNAITSTNGLALGGTKAGNYTLSGVSGSVIIAQAVPAIMLTSSQNPSGHGVGVSFTATLPAYATGTIQFLTNSFLFDTEGLASGSAGSVVTTMLPIGSTTVAAAYSGDANDRAVTNSLIQLVMAPQFSGIVPGPAGLVMSGSWGTSNGTYYVLASTDLSLPTSQWTPVLTNQFDNNGNFIFTNAINTNLPDAFYILEAP